MPSMLPFGASPQSPAYSLHTDRSVLSLQVRPWLQPDAPRLCCCANGSSDRILSSRALCAPDVALYLCACMFSLTCALARAQVAADSHAEVHAGLHALAQRLQRDLPGSLREGAGIISDEGAAAVEAALLAPAADLRYHPHRYLSWDCVACASTAALAGTSLSSVSVIEEEGIG